MTIQTIFSIVVVVFTVTNLAAMGLELNVREAARSFWNTRFVVFTLLWGWVVGPALALFITRVIPLTEAHAAGLLLISLAPTAPFFPMMVRKAGGDMSFAAAFMLLTTIGTVILLPLMAPLLIKGLTVDTWPLAKPLLTMVLLPLLIGVALKVRMPTLADKLFPVVKNTGIVSLLILLAMTLVMYGPDMLGTVGSFAPGAQVLFFVVMTLLSYKVSFGLKQNQRSSIALGMCTRNIAAVFAAYSGITDPPPGMFVMVILVVPLAAIVAAVATRIFAKQAAESVKDNTA